MVLALSVAILQILFWQTQQPKKFLCIDNLSSGRAWHFEHHLNDPRFAFKEGFVEDRGQLKHYMHGHDTVIHLASNPDIAKAATYPAIDFYQGTELTHCVVDAARATGVKRLLYASGSGVYGDIWRYRSARRLWAIATNLHLWCQQVGWRSSYQFLLLYVWSDGLYVSLRKCCRRKW